MQYSSVDNNVQQQHRPDVTNYKFLKIPPCCKTAWCKIGQAGQKEAFAAQGREVERHNAAERGQNRVEAGGKEAKGQTGGHHSSHVTRVHCP